MDGETLLVVEDDVRFRQTLCDILRTRGYTPVGAATGKEALESIEGDVAVALIDLRLPDMDGLEVLREIGARFPGTECILITGHATQGSAIRAVNQGAYGYVQKPCDMDQLLTMIRRAVEKRKTGRALRESEAKYRTLFETMEQGVVYQEASGRIVSANPAAERILGLTWDQMQGRTSVDPRWKAIHEDGSDFPGETHPSTVALKTGRVVDGVVMGVFNPEQEEYRWILINAVPQFRKGEEKPHQVYTTFTDITERKRMEQELLRLERLRAVGELAAGVSHNLNNILTTILGPAQIIRRKTDDPQLLREVEDILISTERARDLVHQLHLSVRTEERETLHPVPVDQVVQQVVQTSHPRWKDEPEARGVSVEVLVQTRGVPPIRGTEAGLHDILTNLLFNAVDALPEGGTISIRTEAVEDQVRIAVSDTGTGMDEATRLRIFEPFFTTKMDLGTGLGLSTVHNTVSRWGGTIEVESAPGEGTTFTLRFPAWQEGGEEKEEVEAASQPTRSGRILVVDDDASIGELLSRLLGGRHAVEAVTDGGQALERFAPDKYDAVLIDLGMSGMPGDQVVARLREIDPRVATVLITGWTLPEIDPRVVPFDFRIEKPFDDLDEIEEVVNRAIELRDERAGDAG